MFKVIKSFTDLQDNNHIYAVGDTYPRKGAKVGDERIAELSSKNNKVGVVLIEEVKDKKTAKKAVETAEIQPETEEIAEVEEVVKPKRKAAKKEK